MKRIKISFVIILLIHSVFIQAQDYTFISSDYHKMDDEELLKHDVHFSPDIPMFDEQGNQIQSDQLNDIMTSGNFVPIIFGNKKHEAKTIVFRKSTKEEKETIKNATTIQNPNATFKTGEIAKDFISSNLKGEKISLNDLKGKIVVLNFWFIQCKPCVEELPELNKIVTKYKNKNVEFIAITFDKQTDLNEFLKTHKFDYNIVSDGEIIRDYNVSTFPLHMILDKKGEIIFKKTGAYIDELDAKIDLLLKK